MKIIKIQIFIQDQKKYKIHRFKGRMKGKLNKIYIVGIELNLRAFNFIFVILKKIT